MGKFRFCVGRRWKVLPILIPSRLRGVGGSMG